MDQKRIVFCSSLPPHIMDAWRKRYATGLRSRQLALAMAKHLGMPKPSQPKRGAPRIKKAG